MRNKGVTIIEILFALAILLGITTILIISFTTLNSRQVLEKNTDLVESTLNQARSLTLSSKLGSNYGIHFETSGVTLFKGTTYSATAPDNIVVNIDSRAVISDVTLNGGGSDVVFERLTGGTNQPGSIKISLVSSASSTHTINILGTGIIEVSP